MLTPDEMDRLIAENAPRLEDGLLGRGDHASATVRRSQVAFLPGDGYEWLYRKIVETAAAFNRRFFGVDIDGLAGPIQLARYDEADAGFYDWHMDWGDVALDRKLSLTVQLSEPSDYDGGDLEFRYSNERVRADRARGLIIAFPSFVLHRVTPVTRGTRYSLVVWLAGPVWR